MHALDLRDVLKAKSEAQLGQAAYRTRCSRRRCYQNSASSSRSRHRPLPHPQQHRQPVRSRQAPAPILCGHILVLYPWNTTLLMCDFALQMPFAEYGGINPELDPELAMAMKQSLEVKQDVPQAAAIQTRLV